MKKIIFIIIFLGQVFLPSTARAQQWVEPYAEKDGNRVEGHWQTPEDSWQKDYKKQGNFNPMTGQFNLYGRKVPSSSANPETTASGPNPLPGSNPDRNVPSPYAVPGSIPAPNAPNPYAIPGSSPPKMPGSGR